MSNTMTAKPQKKITNDELMSLIAKQNETIEALKEQLATNGKHDPGITCKVSDKGALSIYGLGRFPVTLYVTQFDKLDKEWSKVQQFVADNRSKFSVKP